MPLHKIYRKQLKSHVADLSNVGGRSAGSCTAAMFLREFVCFGGTRNDDSDPNEIINGELNWVHLDIAGVMHSKSNDEFGVSQMSGRPTRTLLQFCCDLK